MKDLTLTFRGQVTEDGKIELPRTRFQKEVTGAFRGHAIEVTVKRARRRRSSAQNAYWWSVVIPHLQQMISEYDPEQFITPDLVHEFAKARWLPVVLGMSEMVIETPSGPQRVPWTTTDLTTVQFMHLVQLAQEWAAEFGYVIPDPDGEEVFGTERPVNIDIH